MPPSGYSTKQSHCVGEFLRSCAEALTDEARENRMTLVAALDSELSNIRHYLDNGAVSPAQAAVLQITEAFYRKVRRFAPADKSAFWDAVGHATKDLESQMLAIKVPSVV